MIVDLISNRPQVRLAPGAILHGPDRDFEVVQASAHQKRWIVTLAGVADRNQAELLRGTVLSAEPLEDDGDALWVHEMVGRQVVDREGREHGVVEAVEANPASDLLVLAGERLVPLTFVVDRRPDGTIVIDPPAGLLD